VFPSYEAFLGIVTTMMDQYAKFTKMAMEVHWRPSVPSLNYVASSTLWRQEHNGFSHQNPGFINTLINKKVY
jgi:xylulose-5-phosphate/fructose-6-phosphate phosphoketolase